MSRADQEAKGVERRVAIMGFLRQYIAEKGWAPTMQEIADGVGLVSPNSTRNHLIKLAEEGYIRIEPRQARAIALISPAPDGWPNKDDKGSGQE